MASLKDLRNRIASVKATQKITKAMKMVASSKMRAEVSRLNSGRDFGVHVIPTMLENDSYHKNAIEEFNPQNVLLIPLTTDRLVNKRSMWRYQLKSDQGDAKPHHQREQVQEDYNFYW